MNKRIVVTGGAGFIGSHTCLSLLSAGYSVSVVDNMSNCRAESIERVQLISGKRVELIVADIRDSIFLKELFERLKPLVVIHFAGLKSVSESLRAPVEYYDNNVVGTVRLVDAMKSCGLKNLIFSSSATVYGEPLSTPISEEHPLSATNPYGRTKLVIEEMLRDISRSDASWNIVALRYFNPVGAHESGEIGEDPIGVPNNLFPYIAQVAAGRIAYLSIFGDDFETVDGTGVRDYIHVLDLAEGHVYAVNSMLNGLRGFNVFNLGTGTGYSVREVLRAFESAICRPIPSKIQNRRHGDVAESIADPTRAKEVLGWTAKRGLSEMCVDSWRWQSMYPGGYG